MQGVNTSSGDTRGGMIEISTSGSLTATTLNSNGFVDGGDIDIQASNNIFVGEINASAFYGTGGTVKLWSKTGDVSFSTLSTEAIDQLNGQAGGAVRINALKGNIVGTSSFTASNSEEATISTLGPLGNGTVHLLHNQGNPIDFEIGGTPINGLFSNLVADVSPVSENFIGGTVVGGNFRSTDNTVSISTSPFVTTWVTSDGSITIPTFSGEIYDYDITWTNLTNLDEGDGSAYNEIADHIISGLNIGDTYEITISGSFPRIYFNNEGDKDKILTIEQWGDIAWTSMENAFIGCVNLTAIPTEAPDLSLVYSLFGMFSGTSINQSLDSWDVSGIENFAQMFEANSVFDQDLSMWDMSSAEFLGGMFHAATSYNNGGQTLDSWANKLLSAVAMDGMFQDATSFNQDISTWDVSNVSDMTAMFDGASSFNHNLGIWSVFNVSSMTSMFDNSGLSVINYDGILEGWSQQTVQPGVALGALGLSYSLGAKAAKEHSH